MSAISWASGPDPVPSRRLWIVNAKPKPAVVIVLAPPTGVWLHWLGYRSVPCTTEACAHCAGGLPRRWAGYSPALRAPATHADAQLYFARWPQCVLHVPAGAKPVFEDPLLLGMRLMICAETLGGVRNCLVVKRTNNGLPREEARALAFDVRPVLEQLWNVPELRAKAIDSSTDTVPFVQPKAGAA